jgi:nitrous oxidase accessory protein NosD
MRWLLLPFLAAVAPAQTVWTVPGMFRQIHQALAVAQPGDVIEVANGNYQPFAVTQGVTIRGTGTAVSVGA